MVHRRSLLRAVLAGTGVALCPPARRVVAQSATPVAPQAPDLASLFPDERELPAGLELESAGVREEVGQLAGTFRNSRDAAELLAGWGWIGNAYRSYAARAGAGNVTPARVEISLHQFTSSSGAAYALPYFAHDRAVALHQQEEPGGFLRPCAAVVLGKGEATQFLRQGALVVRVSVAMPAPMAGDADALALRTATELALAVLANTGGTPRALSVGCQ
jgi:hypothetical protein